MNFGTSSDRWRALSLLPISNSWFNRGSLRKLKVKWRHTSTIRSNTTVRQQAQVEQTHQGCSDLQRRSREDLKVQDPHRARIWDLLEYNQLRGIKSCLSKGTPSSEETQCQFSYRVIHLQETLGKHRDSQQLLHSQGGRLIQDFHNCLNLWLKRSKSHVSTALKPYST